VPEAVASERGEPASVVPELGVPESEGPAWAAREPAESALAAVPAQGLVTARDLIARS
jgi:hypothetical protein